MAEAEFVSIPDFASASSLSARTVSRMVAGGALPSLKVGGRRLIPLRDGLEALRRLGEQGASDTECGR